MTRIDELEEENALLHSRLKELQDQYDALDAATSRKIQDLVDENEALAEANEHLMENQNIYQRLHQRQVDEVKVPDELLVPGKEVRMEEEMVLEDTHSFGNLLCLSVQATNHHIIASGGVDKQICIHDYKRNTKVCSYDASAPVLEVSFCPDPALSEYLLASFMDASHALLRLEDLDGDQSLKVVHLSHDHTRHGVLKIAWSASGHLYATGASDKCLHLYKFEDQVELLQSFYFNGTVTAITFAPYEGKEYVVVAVANDCYIHYIDCESFEKSRVNMNRDDIEHVSYTIFDLQLSPTSKYLLAATDTNRHFIFPIYTNHVVRNFIGHKAGAYSQPRVAWHPSEKYIVSNTEEGGSVCTWSVASERLVSTIPAHEALVRDLVTIEVDGKSYLATASYDKLVKVFTLM